MTNIKPIGKRVMVRWDESKEGISAGGIILPKSENRDPLIQCELIAKSDQSEVKAEVGDQVLVGKYAGRTIMIDGARHLICNDVDVVGVCDAG